VRRLADLPDLAREVRADARQRIEHLEVHLGHILGKRFHRRGCATIGPDPERIRPFDLQKIGKTTEIRRHQSVG